MAARSVDLVAKLIADSKGFKRGMDEAALTAKQGEQKLRSIGRGMEQLGSRLTRSVTLPLIGIGVAAVKTFTDFESEMTKIGSLVLGTTEGLDEMSDTIKDLAIATGKGPTELARAMFAIQSAGLRGVDALDALEASAKASAAGLGDTQAIALTAAAAFTAYSRDGLKASDAVDVLVATVREGNLSAEDLAGSLGKVLPVASNAGVALTEVGGAVAVLTRTGASASEAVNMIRGSILQLHAPTKAAQQLLEEAFGPGGISTMMREQGLVETFRALNAEFGHSPELLRRVMGRADALNAVLGITGQDAAVVDEVFRNVADSAGITDEAFAMVAETAGFKFQQAMARTQVALIDLGAVLAPFAASAAEFVSMLIGGFSSLPDSAQHAIVAFGAIAAAMGPLLSLSGKLLTSFAAMPGTFGTTVAKLASLNPMVLGLGAAAGIAGIALFKMAERGREVSRAAEELRTQAEATGRSFEDLAREGMSETFAQSKTLQQAMEQLDLTYGDLGDMINMSSKELKLWREQGQIAATGNAELQGSYREIEKQVALARDAIGLATEQDAEAAKAKRELGVSVDGATSALEGIEDPAVQAALAAAGLGEDVSDAAGAVSGLADELNEIDKQMRGMFDPLFKLQDAVDKNAEAAWKAAEAEREFGKGSKEAETANRDLTRSAVDLESAVLGVAAGVEEGNIVLEDAVAMLDRWAREGKITRQAADEAAWSMGAMVGKAQEISRTPAIMRVFLDAGHAFQELDRLRAAAGQSLIVNASVVARDRRIAGFDDGGVVGGSRGAPQLILAHGGETVLPTHKSGFSGGGQVVNVHVHGNVWSEHDLVETVRSRLADLGKRGGR